MYNGYGMDVKLSPGFDIDMDKLFETMDIIDHTCNDFFWPLDTIESRRAYSDQHQMFLWEWHPFTREMIITPLMAGCGPPSSPGQGGDGVHWDAYYSELEAGHMALFDRWIDEILREMGLDLEDLTENEDGSMVLASDAH